MKHSIIILMIISSTAFLQAEEARVKFIAELPTPGEFTLFANGGWNGNWYVGYNHGWASKLPDVDVHDFEKVYLGARLGRAKTDKQIKKILKSNEEQINISNGPYNILIGISKSKEVRPEGIVLAATDRIPIEGSPVAALEGVTMSRWFWVEYDKKMLSSDSPVYIHLWSEDEELTSAEAAPILAAGLGSNERENSYLVKGDENKDVRTIKFFEPALAVKLVGKNPPVPKIEIESFEKHPVVPEKYIIKTGVSGNYITEVGIELDSGTGWEVSGKIVTIPPYDIAFGFKDLSQGSYKLRCWAKNWWEQIGYSGYKTFTIKEENVK